jgi:hypothetical protein
MHAPTAVFLPSRRGLNGRPDTVNRFLMLPYWVRLPDGKPSDDLKPYSKLFSTEKLRFQGRFLLEGIALPQWQEIRKIQLYLLKIQHYREIA